MNRSFIFVAALVAALASGCASLPPGAHFPKVASTAFDHPDQTSLGRHFAAAAAAHPGVSGFRILNVGVDGLLARAQLINAAERAIDAQYFIFRNDETGELIADAILRAADRGVRVRVLVDDGETTDGDEKLAALRAHPQVEIRVFNPFAYRGHVGLFRAAEFAFHKSRLDYRMHNKLLVVDDAVALIGGRNVGDEYFQVDPQTQFGDDDVFSVGPIVKDLARSFDEFWNCALAIPSEALAPPSGAALVAYREELAEHRKTLRQDGVDYAQRISSGEPLGGLLSGSLPLSWARAQVIADSPNKERIEKGETGGRLMNPTIERIVAQVRSELLMVSPYFIPGQEGMALFADLRRRGVRIRILTNSLMSNNVLAAQAGYMHYRAPLLRDGIELYEVRALLGNPRGSGESKAMTRFGTYSLHGKWFVFDRERVFIGSMNYDQRSMHLNTEIGLLIDSAELAEQTARRFEAIVSLANSYTVLLLPDPADPHAHLAWRTDEDGRTVDHTEEPARSPWQRFEADVLSTLPIDDEL